MSVSMSVSLNFKMLQHMTFPTKLDTTHCKTNNTMTHTLWFCSIDGCFCLFCSPHMSSLTFNHIAAFVVKSSSTSAGVIGIV